MSTLSVNQLISKLHQHSGHDEEEHEAQQPTNKATKGKVKLFLKLFKLGIRVVLVEVDMNAEELHILKNGEEEADEGGATKTNSKTIGGVLVNGASILGIETSGQTDGAGGENNMESERKVFHVD